MKSSGRGRAISPASVEAISPFGLWILVRGEELFLDYKQFPMFLSATIEAVLRVELHGTDHLHWPEIDVDLELESIRHPERFPLMAKPGATRRRVKRKDPAPARSQPTVHFES